MKEEINNCKSLIRNTLLGIYVNLLLVIGVWVFLFWGLINNNYTIWILLSLALVFSEIVNLVLTFQNIRNTYQLYKNGEYNYLRKSMQMLKLSTIPYFLLNFIFYLLLILIFFMGTRGIIIFTPVPLLLSIPIFFTYLTVLCSAAYGVGFIAILWKEKSFTIGRTIMHILLQICFVLDVMDTIVLLRKYKAKEDPNK